MKTTIQIKVGIFVFFFSLFHLTGHAEAADANLAKLRSVTHSSSGDANQCGHLVVDGSLKTYWESEPGGKPWIEIDLGSSQEFHKIVIHWGENFGVEYAVTLSDKEYVTGEEIYNTSKGAGGNTVISCPDKIKRFVRIDVSRVKDPIRGCVINEVEVIGEGEKRFVPSKVVRLAASKLTLDGNIWRIQNAMFVTAKPQEISQPAFDDQEWIPAKVPGTVLGSYYDFGALPDPFFGDNMHQISDEFFSGNDFWYRTSVRFPKQMPEKRLFLNFDGINWKAEIYLNGQYLGRIDGAFLRKEFEVTNLINKDGMNTIAVLIHHPENWMSGAYKVHRKYLGARTTNGDMLGLDSPTFLASSGWNWLPIVRGRNIGIWNNVHFDIRNNVSIKDPWVSSVLPLPDTTRADLVIHAELGNQSSEVVRGTLVAKFGKTTIEHPVTLNANESKIIVLDKAKYPRLTVKNPKLWWPNGYGKQNLYQLSLQFINNTTVSDAIDINFGVRQLDYNVVDNILFIYCNGQKILLRGGNWGMPEGMLRCDSLGYDIRVKLHQEANFNIIRNWVGLTGHEWFYDACDRYGILVWDDFWLANPVDGPDPRDTAMFMNNVRDKIKWVRKHPALALYCGRNEGLPPLGLDVGMNHETQVLDGTRFYVIRSDAGPVTGRGPYDVREPAWYFNNRGVTLHSELGIVAFPEVESMRRMMPEKNLWPIGDMWAIHDYQWGRSEKFTSKIETRYGVPSGIEDYCDKAQLLNYESSKAMFESLQSNQGSGHILWMSQSAWPSLICQLYDYYFEYTSAYFAVKKACEPVHVFWDIAKNKVRVANNTSKNSGRLKVKALLYDFSGTKLWEKSVSSSDIKSNSATTCIDPGPMNGDQVRFLKLELTKDEKVISDNFYWIADSSNSCTELNNLPRVDLDVKTSSAFKDGIYKVNVTLNNTSQEVTLLNKIKVKNRKTEESILPVFFSDDYVSLLPGEKKVVNLEFRAAETDSPELWIEGWNTNSKKISL